MAHLSSSTSGDMCPTCGQDLAGTQRHFYENASPDAVGELLRDLTFVGDGFGCYSTFDVRDDARKWDRDELRNFWADLDYEDYEFCAEAGAGYTWALGTLSIDAVYFWDRDGTLAFRLRDRGHTVRTIANGDCKKGYGWYDAEELPSWGGE